MQIKTSTLVFIDGLFYPIFSILNFIALPIRKREISSKNKIVFVKFFGMGSLVRIASVLKNSNLDLSQVTLITLKKNQSITDELGIRSVFIRTNLLWIGIDIINSLVKVWLMSNTRVVDLERSSNLAGIFGFFLAIGKPSSSFYFQEENQEKKNHLNVSLKNKRAVDGLYEVFEIIREEKNDESLKSTRKQFVVNINAGEYLPERKYPLELFAVVVESIYYSNKDLKVVLTGSLNENKYVSKFEKLLKQKNVSVENKAGKQSITELIDELKSSKFLITNDSGPLHLANYYGVPCAVIWGPTSPKLVGYPNSDKMKNISLRKECSPCFFHPKSEVAKSCNGRISCFAELSPDKIVTEILEFKSNLEKSSNGE